MKNDSTHHSRIAIVAALLAWMLVVAYPGTCSASQGSQFGIVASTWLGDTTNTDGVVGVRLQADGTIIIAVNSGAKPFNLEPLLLGGAVKGSRGMIVRLSSDGKTALSAARIADSLSDLELTADGSIAVAAGRQGIMVVTSDVSALLWSKPLQNQGLRIAVGKSGNIAVLNANRENSGSIYLFDKNGTELISYPGLHYTQDVALDDSRGLIFTTGYHVTSSGTKAESCHPVHVSYLRAHDFSGKLVWSDYGWAGTQLEPLPCKNGVGVDDNNMADTRGYRVNMGEDGYLYCAFECAGGNHIFRYEPKDLKKPVPLVLGDRWHAYGYTTSEHKLVFARFAPATGDYLKGQQICTSFWEGNRYKGNTFRIKDGDIQVDSAGRVYLVGSSASGLPFTGTYGYLPAMHESSFNPFSPQVYTGGAHLFVMDSTFSKRLFVTRLSGGSATCFDRRRLADGTERIVYGGFASRLRLQFPSDNESDSLMLHTMNPLQSTANSAVQEGFVTVMGTDGTSFSQPNWVLNFDGHYASTNLALRDGKAVGQALTINGSEARQSGFPFSTSIPLSPYQNYTGPRFFGGVEAIRIGSEAFNFATPFVSKSDKSLINITYTSAKGAMINTAIYFDSADFAAPPQAGKYFFDRQSMVIFQGATFGNARYLVRNGSSFYISQKKIDTNIPLLFGSDGDDGKWAPFHPDQQMRIDTTGSSYQTRNFDDITAVGIVIGMHQTVSDRLWLKFQTFRLALSNTSGPSPVLHNSALQRQGGVAFGARIANTSIQFNQPPHGSLVLYDISGRTIMQWHADGRRNTFALPQPLAPGLFLLRGKDLQGNSWSSRVIARW